MATDLEVSRMTNPDRRSISVATLFRRTIGIRISDVDGNRSVFFLPGAFSRTLVKTFMITRPLRIEIGDLWLIG